MYSSSALLGGKCDFSLIATSRRKTGPNMASNSTAEYPLKRECRLLCSPVRLRRRCRHYRSIWFFFFFLQNCLAECKSDWQPVTAEMLQWNVPNASWNDFSVINWHPTMLGSLSRYRDTDLSWHRLLSRKSVIEDLVAKQWPCRPSESTTVRVIIGS